MKLTASMLIAQSVCGFLRHVQYAVRQPLPFGGGRRRLGSVLHAVIAFYEKSGRRLQPAIDALRTFVLPDADLREAREILEWRHGQDRDPERRPFLIEGALHAALPPHTLDVRLDRLDRREGDYVLAEYKTGRTVDLEPVRTQLRILAYAAGRALGAVPSEWEVELLGARRVVRVEAETDRAELERFVSGLAAAVDRDDREPRPSDPAFCRRCPARSYCPRGSASPLPLREPLPHPEPTQLALF